MTSAKLRSYDCDQCLKQFDFIGESPPWRVQMLLSATNGLFVQMKFWFCCEFCLESWVEVKREEEQK